MAALLSDLLSSALSTPEVADLLVPRPPLDHQSNLLFDLPLHNQQLIVKVFEKPEDYDEAPERKFAAMKTLRPLDIAPQPVFFHPGDADHPKPVVVYEYMTGKMWDRTAPDPDRLAGLARVWLQMHNVESPVPWKSRSDWVVHRAYPRFTAFLQKYQAWSRSNFDPGQQVVRLLTPIIEKRETDLAVLENAKPVRCFSRADPRFANVIQRPDGRIGMVDWEDSGWMDPAIDVADLLTNPNQEDLLSPTDREAFLGPYLAELSIRDPGLPGRITRYTGLFLLFRFIQFLQMCFERYNTKTLDGWKINGLPAIARLRRYLAKASLWPQPMGNDDLADYADHSFFPGF